MHNLKRLSLIGVLVLAAGCASGPSILVDRDPTADLQAYRTFGFYDRQDTDRSRYSTIVTQHLKQATRTELERLGYVYDESAPELRVNFILEVEQRQELRTSPGSLGFVGPRGYGAWGGYDLTTVSYKAGTLRVELVDAARNALVWQGVAEGTLDGAALENPGATVGRTIAGMFSNFPGAPAR
jgi:hypothetical protein